MGNPLYNDPFLQLSGAAYASAFSPITLGPADPFADTPSSQLAGSGLPGLPSLTGTQSPAASSPSTGGYTGNSFIDAILGWDPLTNKIDTPTNNVVNGGGGVDPSSIAGLKDWTVTRVTTIALGLIVIIVGLVALSRGPAVNIVSGAIKEAAIA